MAKKDADAPKPAGPADQFISVRGPEDGRWRADIRFGPIATELCLAAITAEQLALIEGDEMLEVRKIAGPVAPEPSP